MSAAVISPQAALEALTINDSGPSTSLNSPTNGTHSIGGSYIDHPNDDLGLPADAHVIRVPEGEQYRVRALYDFEATDESALSFNTGDVIEVLTMLPSGWWDGMLGNNRGWFPSNYVEDVDETDLEFYARNGAANDVLRPHHSLSSTSWGGDGDGGWGTDGSSTSLDDLALELMGNSGVVARQTLASNVGSSASDNDPRRRTDLGRRDTSDFNPRRGDADPDETLHPLTGRQGGHIDAWIPSLTPDGRVYYHNTQTGEDAWEIPEDDDATYASTGSDPSTNLPKRRESRQALQKPQLDGSEDNRRPSSRPISMASSHASRPPSSALLMDDQFGIPPRATSLPPPWVARLTDDGRGWYYFNTVTGEQRREPPVASAREAGSEPLHRSSIGSTLNTPQGGAQQPRRGTEWEERIRQSLAPLVVPPPQPTMAILIEAVSEALREVFDAAIAGSSAEEELLLTRETNVGFEIARRHDQASVEQAASAQKAVINAVRDLVVACGYVGPLIPLQSGQESQFSEEMVRPKWAKDMSLVGSLGLLALTTHNAITGPRSEEHGSSAWTDVLRAATKLRVVVEAFPGLAHPDTPPPERDGLEGGRLAAWFGVDNLGDFMSGRFGFGHLVDPHLRPLDQAAVVEVQKIKAEVEAALRATATGQDDSVLEILRAVTHYRDAVGHIDIAVTIDLDGDASTPNGTDAPTSGDDLKAYNELISRARQTLRDLDEASRSLDSVSADLFLRSEGNGTSQIRDTINSNVSSILRSLQGLLLISQQQAASLEHGVVRGALGHRSPTKVGVIRAAAETSAVASSAVNASVNRVSTPPDRNRTHSISSTASRLSRQSMPGHIRGPSTAETHRTRPSGSEQELLEQVQPSRTNEDGKRRSILSTIGSKSGHSPSASQTSLSTSARREASSSSTSLPYPHPELDATSIRSSNRASILKAVPSFLRNRSGSEIEHEDAARASKKSKKLSKILGEEIGIHRSSSSQSSSRAPLSPITTAPSIPAPMPPPAAARAGQAAWYLETDYPPGEIVFDDRGNVKAGTIRALVERLTPHTAADTAYFQAFMLTYRSFVTTDELVEHLIRRYHVEPPADLNEEQLKEWKLRKMTPIRLRVANTFKAWLDNQFMEDRDGHALDVVEEFARTTLVANGSELMSKQLLALIERRRRGDSTAQARRVVMGAVLPSPAPILPRMMSAKGLHVLNIDPLELARQLTIMEANSFQRIKPAECLNKAWQSTALAPNIHHVTNLHNRISCWCGSLILQERDPKSRANVLKYFIKVATELRALNNFASMASIIAGLNLSPISRLKQSWAQLSEKLLKEWSMLEKLFDSTKNFARYKELLKMINPPCVPFFAFYQTSLVFIEDGNKDMVPLPSSQPMSPTSSGGHHSMRDSTTFSVLTGTTAVSGHSGHTGHNANAGNNKEDRPMLINFFKRQLTADILRDIQQYQSQPYNLAVCKPVQQYIEQGLETVEISIDVLYELSLKVEAKQQQA